MPPLTRPPQYGPFPSAASGSSHGELGMGMEQALTDSGSQAAHMLAGGLFTSPHGPATDPAWRELHSPEGYRRTAGFTAQLSGPGIPGSATSPSSPESFRGPEASRPRTSYTAMGNPRRHTITRPWTSERPEHLHVVPNVPPPIHRHSTDFAVRLPPLQLSRPRSRTFGEHGTSRGIRSPLARAGSPPVPTRLPPLHPDSPFAYEPPFRLPPPFTLQPRPQWDDPSFNPYSRPHPESHHHHADIYERTTLPSPTTQEDDLTLAPAYFPPPTAPSHGLPSLRPISSPPLPSLPGPSTPWRARPTDDDKRTRDDDAPR